jgi:outer membrane protein
MRKYLIILFAAAFISTAGAQTAIKLGHINSQELIEAMPESDSAQKKIEKLTKDIQGQYEAMQVEYNTKLQDYQSKRETYSDLIKQTKENELQELGQRIQAFAQNADQDLQKQRTGLYKPVLDKANKAIADVSKENGFTYVFDLAGGLIIYHAENSTDILPLVKAKLGLK